MQKQRADALRRDEKTDEYDRKADASTRQCVDDQSMNEESVEETEKDNVQTWKEVRERKEMSRQLSKESKWEVNDII